MNDKSKNTAKARQDLKRLGIRSGLWLGQTKNGKCSKPQAAYSFTPENKKKFSQFIKGVKLRDGFGSNFKHKVTDNDTNITGLKSHDCHIMMQRLLPYGLQNYLPDNIAKPIIELSSLFKQLCSATLMEDDMLKASVKVVEILCELERIYPPAFFDIMIHLVIHLPLEALEGGPIRPWWMFPFERFMKKLKGYVQNKAMSEGSIAEGYVAEEALTFCSHYFRDVTTKFNRPDRNVDPHPPTCQFQVFQSICKSIGLRSVIRFDAQELKKVTWYVLHNSLEIDTYRSQFKSKFPNKDMKEEFPNWFGSQLFALACRPTPTPISVNSCIVNDVRFVMHSRDERRTTQNSGICLPGRKDREMYYGQLPEILEFLYLSFKVVLFRVKWFDTSNEGRKVKHLVLRNNMTQILTKGEAFKDDQYILATQMLHGTTAVTVAVMIVPLHTIYPPVSGVASLTEAKAPENPIWAEGKRAGCIPARRPETSDPVSLDTSYAIPALARYQCGHPAAPVKVVQYQQGFPQGSTLDWDAQIAFWNDPRNQARAAQNRQNQAKSTVVCRQGSRSLARLRDQMMESSATREYPSLIHTFFVTHTVNGVFTRDEDRAIYEEMLRLQALGSNTPSGVPYTEEEINALARKGKQRGHLPCVGRVNLMMKLFRSDDKISQMLNQYESTPEFGNGIGGCGDDEMADDEDDCEDEEDEEDGDS
ncbi:hypothetical protein Tco_0409203 [Tanacetum coccineum]